jgi:hypothetical protein
MQCFDTFGGFKNHRKNLKGLRTKSPRGRRFKDICVSGELFSRILENLTRWILILFVFSSDFLHLREEYRRFQKQFFNME